VSVARGRKSELTLPTCVDLATRYDTSEKDEDLPYLLDDRFAICLNNTVSLDDSPSTSRSRAAV